MSVADATRRHVFRVGSRKHVDTVYNRRQVHHKAQVLALSTSLIARELVMTELTSRRRSPVNADAPASPGVFGRIGSLVVRRSRRVLLVTLIVFLAGAGLGLTAFGKLKTGGFTDPN